MSAGPIEPTTPAAAETPAALTAADVMTAVARTCSPFSTVTEAVMFFKELDADVVPVVDAGKPVGVVVDRDVALAVADVPDLAERPVSEIMVKDFPVIEADAPVEAVLQTMAAAGARMALVVDAEGLLAGLIFEPALARRLAAGETAPPVADDATPSAGAT